MKVASEKGQDMVHFSPNIGDEEIDRRFNRLFEKLLDYTKSIIDLVEGLCPDEAERLRLALKIGETDGRLLPRLVEKEVEKRRIIKLKAEMSQPTNAETKPIKLQEIISEREIEAVQVEEIVEMILETRKAQQMQAITVNKSSDQNGKLSAVLFSLCGGPEKGLAVFIPEEDQENIGALHIFDEYGMKRKIRSKVKIIDLDKYEEKDVYDPYKREQTSSFKGVRAPDKA